LWRFRKPLASDSPMALTTLFPIFTLSKQMRSSHAIDSVRVRLSYARSLLRTRWTNPLLCYRVPAPGSSLSAVMQPFTRMMHSFNTTLPRQRYGTSRMFRFACDIRRCCYYGRRRPTGQSPDNTRLHRRGSSMCYPAPDPSDERGWLEIKEEAGHWWLRSGIWPLNR
jgi:hypothetical protein